MNDYRLSRVDIGKGQIMSSQTLTIASPAEVPTIAPKYPEAIAFLVVGDPPTSAYPLDKAQAQSFIVRLTALYDKAGGS